MFTFSEDTSVSGGEYSSLCQFWVCDLSSVVVTDMLYRRIVSHSSQFTVPGGVRLSPLQRLEEGGQAGPLERGGTEASEMSGTASTLCSACRGWGGRGPWGP